MTEIFSFWPTEVSLRVGQALTASSVCTSTKAAGFLNVKRPPKSGQSPQGPMTYSGACSFVLSMNDAAVTRSLCVFSPNIRRRHPEEPNIFPELTQALDTSTVSLLLLYQSLLLVHPGDACGRVRVVLLRPTGGHCRLNVQHSNDELRTLPNVRRPPTSDGWQPASRSKICLHLNKRPSVRRWNAGRAFLEPLAVS
jgi:hypothetical protein